MNLIEHYIKEVHSEEIIAEDWGSFVQVEVTINCYGRIERVKTSFSTIKEWEKAKKQGYYMA